MAQEYVTLTLEAYKKLCGLIRESHSVADAIDDSSIATNSTYSSAKITELFENVPDLDEYYTKTETSSMITRAVANADHLKRSIVDTLPDIAEADENTIYMRSIIDGEDNQKYEEFMLINGGFEKIGDSAVDLTDYATKTDVETAIDEKVVAGVPDEDIEALFTTP